MLWTRLHVNLVHSFADNRKNIFNQTYLSHSNVHMEPIQRQCGGGHSCKQAMCIESNKSSLNEQWWKSLETTSGFQAMAQNKDSNNRDIWDYRAVLSNFGKLCVLTISWYRWVKVKNYLLKKSVRKSWNKDPDQMVRILNWN